VDLVRAIEVLSYFTFCKTQRGEQHPWPTGFHGAGIQNLGRISARKDRGHVRPEVACNGRTYPREFRLSFTGGPTYGTAERDLPPADV
jgi:hypothetical protein